MKKTILFLLLSIVACNIGTGSDDVNIDSFNPADDGGASDVPDVDTPNIYEEKDASRPSVDRDSGFSSVDAGSEADSGVSPPNTCQEAKLTCGNFHPPTPGSHVEFCGQCFVAGQGCSDGVNGGTCKPFDQVCTGKNVPKYLGTCETFVYSFNEATCALDITDRSSKDYYSTNLLTPKPCDEKTQNFVCGETGQSTTVGTTVWNTVNKHDDAVGGAENDYAYVGGANPLCTRTIHWLYSPYWTRRHAELLAADQGQLFVLP